MNDIVRKIRFEDGQAATEDGKREVRKALRRTLSKYKPYNEELFETCVEPVETKRMGMSRNIIRKSMEVIWHTQH